MGRRSIGAEGVGRTEALCAAAAATPRSPPGLVCKWKSLRAARCGLPHDKLPSCRARALGRQIGRCPRREWIAFQPAARLVNQSAPRGAAALSRMCVATNWRSPPAPSSGLEGDERQTGQAPICSRRLFEPHRPATPAHHSSPALPPKLRRAASAAAPAPRQRPPRPPPRPPLPLPLLRPRHLRALAAAACSAEE